MSGDVTHPGARGFHQAFVQKNIRGTVRLRKIFETIRREGEAAHGNDHIPGIADNIDDLVEFWENGGAQGPKVSLGPNMGALGNIGVDILEGHIEDAADTVKALVRVDAERIDVGLSGKAERPVFGDGVDGLVADKAFLRNVAVPRDALKDIIEPEVPALGRTALKPCHAVS